MTKNEYIKRLKRALGDLDKEEKDKLLEYYRELIDDGVESGKSEESVVGELELPETVARDYRTETGRASPQSSSSEHKENPIGKILMAILGVFVAFAGFWVLFGLCIAGISVFFSGIVVFFTAFGMFVKSAAAAFAQIGAGLLLLGIGELLLALTVLIGKAFAALLCTLFSAKRKTFRIKGASIFCAVAGGCCAIGLLIFLAGFSVVGFEGYRLIASGDLLQREETLTLEDSLSLISDDLKLDIMTTEGEAKLVYSEFEDLSKQFSYENGTIRLFSRERSSFYIWWNQGIFFSIFAKDYNNGTLYLPVDYSGSFEAELENGEITGRDLTLSNLTLNTKNGAIFIEGGSFGTLHAETKNGSVKLNHFTADSVYTKSKNGAVKIAGCEGKDISAQTNNGAVLLENCTAETLQAESNNGAVKLARCLAEHISGKTSNGAVNIEEISAQNIELSTSNGAIKGSIAGNSAEYRIDVKADLGSCNLYNKTDGDKILTVRTSCGAINIIFTE